MDLANRSVNRLISYQTDEQTYRKLDYWASPYESLERGFGDCEDYAILKMALLAKMGVPTNAMSMIVTINDILAEHDPVHADDYDNQANQFLKTLKKLQQWIGEEIDIITPNNRLLITSHDHFRYFAKRFGFM